MWKMNETTSSSGFYGSQMLYKVLFINLLRPFISINQQSQTINQASQLSTTTSFKNNSRSNNNQSTCLTPVARISLPVSVYCSCPPRCGLDNSHASAEAKEEITPDSTKSTQDKIKETFTDTTDRLARGTQSDQSKSTTQEAFDKTQRSHDNTAHGGASQSMSVSSIFILTDE